MYKKDGALKRKKKKKGKNQKIRSFYTAAKKKTCCAAKNLFVKRKLKSQGPRFWSSFVPRCCVRLAI